MTTTGLPAPTRRAASVVAATCAAVGVVLGTAIVVGWSPMLRLDAAIEDAVHGWAVRTPWAVDVSRVLDRMGLFPIAFVVAAATVLLLLALRRWRAAAAVAVVAALAPWLTDRIKLVVERARPAWQDPLGSEPTYSYPSGHATAGIAVYAVCGVALGALLRDRRWAWAVVVALGVVGIAIGLSRVVLGVHWPSDVVGGWCVATAVGAAVGAALVLRRDP